MQRLWITLLFIICAKLIFAAEPVTLIDSSRQAQGTNHPDIKQTKLIPPSITKLRSEILENDILLKWTISSDDSIQYFRIEKITDEETKEAGEIKSGEQEIFDGEYIFKDPINAKEREAGKVVYRIRGLDSSGQLLVQKQIMVNIEDGLTGYALDQNFPNPFNPLTTIEYRLPEQKHVSIKVYNILGNHIATLVDETKPAGTYKTEFNGLGLTSGVYMYTIQAGEYTETKRMILMK